MLIEVEDPSKGKAKQVGIPIKLSGTPGEVETCSPLFGEHTDEVMLSLGYSSQEIEELHQIGEIA